MAIRPATPDDVDSMVDVATASRFAHQAWEPDLWAPLSSEVGLQPVLMRAQIESGRSISLVSDADGRVDGWIRARAEDSTGRWVVDELAVVDPHRWSTVGRALVVAIASRARGNGASGLHLTCPRADVTRALMLGSSGLTRVAAVRHRSIGSRPEHPPAGVRALVDADTAEYDALRDGAESVAECLGAARADTRAGLVVDDGDGLEAAAIVRATRRRAAPVAGGRGVAVAEPVLVRTPASWSTQGDRLLDGIEWLASRRGELHLLVPCAVGETDKERCLDLRGYGWPLDVWTLRW